jgi:hypothetical protein
MIELSCTSINVFYDIIYYRAPDPEAQDARIPKHDLPRYVHLIFDSPWNTAETSVGFKQ